MMLHKGQKIYGPDEQGYELTRDIVHGDNLKDTDFKPFGGAHDPRPGEQMPEWLVKAIHARERG